MCQYYLRKIKRGESTTDCHFVVSHFLKALITETVQTTKRQSLRLLYLMTCVNALKTTQVIHLKLK